MFCIATICILFVDGYFAFVGGGEGWEKGERIADI